MHISNGSEKSIKEIEKSSFKAISLLEKVEGNISESCFPVWGNWPSRKSFHRRGVRRTMHISFLCNSFQELFTTLWGTMMPDSTLLEQ